MCGRGNGKNKRKLEDEDRKESDKIAEKVARTRTEKSENKKQEKFEKEYAERMALPASEDKVWWGYGSREEIEAKMEEVWGHSRYKQGSKHCRLCFGYGCSNVHGEACEHCVCYCEASRKYLGRDRFAIHCD